MLTSEILIPVIDKKGDASVTIKNEKLRYTTSVKKFVADAFVQNIDQTKLYIRHIDFDKTNNHHANLIGAKTQQRIQQNNNTSGCSLQKGTQ